MCHVDDGHARPRKLTDDPEQLLVSLMGSYQEQFAGFSRGAFAGQRRFSQHAAASSPRDQRSRLRTFYLVDFAVWTQALTQNAMESTRARRHLEGPRPATDMELRGIVGKPVPEQYDKALLLKVRRVNFASRASLSFCRRSDNLISIDRCTKSGGRGCLCALSTSR
jgi:hypothetical protein